MFISACVMLCTMYAATKSSTSAHTEMSRLDIDMHLVHQKRSVQSDIMTSPIHGRSIVVPVRTVLPSIQDEDVDPVQATRTKI